MQMKFKFFYIISEPIGGSKPKFSIVTDLMRYSHGKDESISLSCPAQGSPIPTFRLVARVIFNNSNLSEPVGGSAPKFSGNSHLSGLIGKKNHFQTLSCPAQGSPVPTFRLVFNH